jgi:hypothetical protein
MPGCDFRHFGEIPRPERGLGGRLWKYRSRRVETTTTRLRPACDVSNTRMIGSLCANVYFPGGTYAVWSSDISLGRGNVTPQ